MELKGKNALVTGAASGIGLACVKELLNAGVSKCALLDFNTASGEKITSEIEAEYGRDRVLFVECDVTSKASFEACVKRAKCEFVSLDIFVNNAGIWDDDNWEKMVQTNLNGTIIGTTLAFEHMGVDKGGHGGAVVNMSSIAGILPSLASPVYAASKHGIIGYTRSMGFPVFLKETGVRVMAICPGPTNTGLLQNGIDNSQDDLKGELLEQLNFLGYQEPISVAKSLIEILIKGKNGSVWTVYGESSALEIKSLHLKDLLKDK